MKLIIDAHLPKSLAPLFRNCEVIHSSSLEKGNATPDRVINDLSIKEKGAVITKDTDFYYSYLSSGRPYKLVLVKLGNMRLQELKNWFEKNADAIINILQEHSFLILEPERIRILE